MVHTQTKAGKAMDIHKQILALAEGFSSCGEMLSAIGDETRQYLILEMLKLGNCNGVRVCEITQKTNLSRAAVSHHLRILKNAGIVKVRKEGTKNYYYFSPETQAFERLVSTLSMAKEISEALPDRGEKD